MAHLKPDVSTSKLMSGYLITTRQCFFVIFDHIIFWLSLSGAALFVPGFRTNRLRKNDVCNGRRQQLQQTKRERKNLSVFCFSFSFVIFLHYHHLDLLAVTTATIQSGQIEDLIVSNFLALSVGGTILRVRARIRPT